MNLPNDTLQHTLSQLVGLYRQLLDIVRAEREALTQADKKGIQDAAFAKEAMLQALQAAERARTSAVAEIAVAWMRPVAELTLGAIIREIEPHDAKRAEQLRSSLNALVLLVQRVQEQNEYNGALIERSLENIQVMKGNILGAADPSAQTYTPQGQKSAAGQQARLISQEA